MGDEGPHYTSGMATELIVSEPEVTPVAVDDALDGYVEEELLVEEISIDGMCGVY